MNGIWIVLLGMMVLWTGDLHAQSSKYIWVEGESATEESRVTRHPWWYDQVKAGDFSGGDFISNWSETQAGLAVYQFDVPTAGDYDLWLRVNPSQATMTVGLNEGDVKNVPMNQAQDKVNVARDGKNDLRHLGWILMGTHKLKAGKNRMEVGFESKNHHHGYLDAFTFVQGGFTPFGAAKPDEVQEKLASSGEEGWIPWTPVKDPHTKSVIDLRALNESQAGSAGRIVVRDGSFVRERDGGRVRFWAVNGPRGDLRGEDLQHALRDLAKRGVNLIRIHGSVFDKKTGEMKPESIARLQEITARAKREGIYTHYSIYFPLWFQPQPGLAMLEGYDGQTYPFAALYINQAFEAVYQGWWQQLLTAENRFGVRLIDEPALMGVELVNEDSFFFWTFKDEALPEAQRKMIEEMFYEWVISKYKKADRAYEAWGGMKLSGDLPDQKRLDLRPLYNIFTDRKMRDQDTAQFLAETQRGFYERQVTFLKKLGYKGLITASNWHTANDQIFKPIEIWTYLPGDFIDRHGYFGTLAEGEHADWSMRPRHVYADRSALKFEPRTPGNSPHFSHPVADPKYNNLPSMISETTWTRPNRYRTEAPLFYAAYASLQGSDAVVHFAHDTARWEVKPGYWMQPWTLMSPSQMGQFPATALMYRLGYIDEGKTLAKIGLETEDLFALKGTPLVQKGNLDELRLVDVKPGGRIPEGEVVDPRIHFMGKTEVHIGEKVPKNELQSLEPYLDEGAKILRGSNGQIELDYGKGILKVNAPRAQALSGNLAAAGVTQLDVLVVDSPLDLGHVILVSLDGRPLSHSRRMLLQVMSEERNSGWEQEDLGDGTYRVLSLGRDPWRFKAIEGRMALKRADAAGLKVTALDLNGYPIEVAGTANNFELREETVYYLIH
ncbi:hypothetical protein P0Y35_10265 [Kiritimatiellaeota bacterium B1221]|nr:hypothetical protein [Kiritimatiellaeota bacterium B1221]